MGFSFSMCLCLKHDKPNTSTGPLSSMLALEKWGSYLGGPAWGLVTWEGIVGDAFRAVYGPGCKTSWCFMALPSFPVIYQACSQ